MGEPGGLPSMELHRVGHDWSDLAAAAVAAADINQSKQGQSFLIVCAKVSILKYQKSPNLAILGWALF